MYIYICTIWFSNLCITQVGLGKTLTVLCLALMHRRALDRNEEGKVQARQRPQRIDVCL
jgi:hypothetical protein